MSTFSLQRQSRVDAKRARRIVSEGETGLSTGPAVRKSGGRTPNSAKLVINEDLLREIHEADGETDPEIDEGQIDQFWSCSNPDCGETNPSSVNKCLTCGKVRCCD